MTSSNKGGLQGGFTLIELMIVVAIIGLISALAVPQYMNYIAQSKTTSAMVQLGALRTMVLVYAQENEAMPGTPAVLGVDPDEVSDYWQNPNVDAGTVSVEFLNIDNDLNGETISMVPSLMDGLITGWVCTSTASSKNKLPRECRS